MRRRALYHLFLPHRLVFAMYGLRQGLVYSQSQEPLSVLDLFLLLKFLASRDVDTFNSCDLLKSYIRHFLQLSHQRPQLGLRDRY